MMIKQVILAGSLMAASCLAQAADNGLYLGAGVNRTDFDLDSALDDKDNGYKAIVGLRLLDSFGLELNYADHGEAQLQGSQACIALVGVICPSGGSADAKTTSAYAVGFLDFPLVDLFAKAGVAYLDASIELTGVPSNVASQATSSTDFAWGAGVQAHFLSFAVRAEYERFESDRKLSVLSASFIYTFL